MSMSIIVPEYPTIYSSCSETARSSQKHFLWAVRLRLAGTVTAAVAGLAYWELSSVQKWFGTIAVASFLVSIFAELYILRGRPDRVWYQARAGAESIKTLCWRYAVGGEPFGKSTPAAKVESLLLARMTDTLDTLRDLLLVAPSSPGVAITDWMSSTRGDTLAQRKGVYLGGRVNDQISWYTSKAKDAREHSTVWSSILIGCEFAGFMCAVLGLSFGFFGGAVGVCGAAAAAAAAWSETKQFHSLGVAYSVTALEIGVLATKVEMPAGEDAWAAFVEEAEQAFSREHRLWQASRGNQSLAV